MDNMPLFTIRNISGADCYLNTALQCLLAIRTLNNKIMDPHLRWRSEGDLRKDTIKSALLDEYRDRLLEAKEKMLREGAPKGATYKINYDFKDFKDIFISLSRFREGRQQDSGEALIFILNNFVEKEPFLREEIQYSIQEIHICYPCGKRRNEEEKAITLMLKPPIPQRGIRSVALEDLIFAYTEMDTPEAKCDECGNRNTSSLKIEKKLFHDVRGETIMPRNLVILFNRTSYTEGRNNIEISVPIQWQIPGDDKRIWSYSIEAYGIHGGEGSSMSCGHYETHVKKNGRWFSISDISLVVEEKNIVGNRVLSNGITSAIYSRQ